MIQKYLFLLLTIVGGVWACPDFPQLGTMLFAVSAVCSIGLLVALVIGVADGWGIFPRVDFALIVDRATSTPEGCAKVIQGWLVFLGLIVLAIFKAQ